MKKSHHGNNVTDSNIQSRLKIDEERVMEGESIKKTKNSLRFFFGGNKRQPKDIFENSNEVLKYIHIHYAFIHIK